MKAERKEKWMVVKIHSASKQNTSRYFRIFHMRKICTHTFTQVKNMKEIVSCEILSLHLQLMQGRLSAAGLGFASAQAKLMTVT